MEKFGHHKFIKAKSLFVLSRDEVFGSTKSSTCFEKLYQTLQIDYVTPQNVQINTLKEILLCTNVNFAVLLIYRGSKYFFICLIAYEFIS